MRAVDFDQLFDGYCRLWSLQSQIGSGSMRAPERLVQEYHSILDQLIAASGRPLYAYRIPSFELRSSVGAAAMCICRPVPLSGPERSCNSDLLRGRIDELLRYFETQAISPASLATVS